MTIRRALLPAVLAAAVLAAAAVAAPPRYVPHDVVFVTQNGKGVVTSTPTGLHCPSDCRAVFHADIHVVLHATPAPGWRIASFGSKWCTGRDGKCGFDLVSPHDCPGGLCPLGAYGVRIAFVRESG